jgi:hypothetical protein
MQIWLFGKTPIVENMLIADVPPPGRYVIAQSELSGKRVGARGQRP